MDRREQVREWLALRERQGLTFRELAERTGVPVGTLGSWAWKLRREAADESAPSRPRSSFVELVGRSSEACGRIEIVLAGDRRIVVSGEIDEASLSRIVRALERC